MRVCPICRLVEDKMMHVLDCTWSMLATMHKGFAERKPTVNIAESTVLLASEPPVLSLVVQDIAFAAVSAMKHGIRGDPKDLAWARIRASQRHCKQAYAMCVELGV